MKMKNLAGVVVAALMTTGCPADTYDDAEVLAEEIGCTDIQPTEEAGADSVVLCTYANHEDPLRVIAFDEDEPLDRYLTTRETRIQPTVHGDNWAITGPPEALVDVHEDVGGS